MKQFSTFLVYLVIGCSNNSVKPDSNLEKIEQLQKCFEICDSKLLHCQACEDVPICSDIRCEEQLDICNSDCRVLTIPR